MPLSNQQRNAIVAQLDAAFAALEAGDLAAIDAMIHDSFEFSTGGRTYIVSVTGGGMDGLLIRVKRKPL